MDALDILDSPGKRLKWAREQRTTYATASEAARAFGWKVSTYLGHENGDRTPSRKAARKYAFAYKVPWPWLLEGGPLPDSPRDPADRPGLFISYARNDEGMSAVLKLLENPVVQERLLMEVIYDHRAMSKGSEEEQAIFTLVRYLKKKQHGIKR
jgi:hypothetical protein